jgi:hypothetical protein
LGTTSLGSTTIAGDLSVDGTFSVSENKINAIGTLYLQSSALAEELDIFNGKVVIDKNGGIVAQSLEVAEIRITPDKSTGNGSIGTDQNIVEITNPLAKSNSKIFVTPKTLTDQVIAVTEKTDGKFKVSTNSNPSSTLDFDYWIIN